MKQMNWFWWLVAFVLIEAQIIYEMSNESDGWKDVLLVLFIFWMIVFIPILYHKSKK